MIPKLMSIGRPKVHLHTLLAIGLVSCSMLMYEILLTRIAALRLFFHFAFLVISNCLLAVGASGTLIALFQERWKSRPRFWIWFFSVGFVVSLLLTYLFLLTFNVNADLHFADPMRIVRFTVYNLVAAVPFFFAGTVIGLIITFNSQNVNKVYGVDLLGAGFGCLLSPFALWLFGAGGCFVVLTIFAVAGVLAAAPHRFRKPSYALGAVLILVGAASLPWFDSRFPVPGKGSLDLTDKHQAEMAKQILLYSKWSATSRVDLIDLAPENRFMFCRGTKLLNEPLPDTKLIVQDCTAGTLILNFAENPEALEILDQTMYCAAVKLKENPRVFIIGVGGGPDVWAAKINGASYIKGIELNQQILDVHTEVLPEFSTGITQDPNIDLEFGEGRSSLMADKGTYDIIQMTGIDTWTSLASGAYMLAENYLYTREAIENMYDHLAEGGILQLTRMAADMETLRMLSNINAAFEHRGIGDFENSVICLHTPDPLIATLVKKGTFTPEEVDQVARFAEAGGITPVYLPGRNLGGVVEEFIKTKDKAKFIADFPRDISPTTDDKPYFFNFYKWRNPFSAAPYIAEPSHVSQGNPLFILGQLALSTVLAVALIILPLLVFRRQGVRRDHFKSFLVYFAGLGVGFIAIEIAMMQKLTLMLGHPLYSITVTLFTVLIFTGIGSVISESAFRRAGPQVWVVPILLAILLLIFTVASPRLVTTFIGYALPVRIAVAVALLAPAGLLLGIPFAYGIRLLNHFNPSIIPWAWAVNACCTVIGSILTVVISMNFGFSSVFAFAVVIYFIAFAAVSRFRIAASEQIEAAPAQIDTSLTAD